MLFNSYFFIFIFLPITLFLFFSLGKIKPQAALSLLLLASIVFYGWNDYHYLLILLPSILVNYLISRFIIDAKTKLARQLLLFTGISFNLILLGYFKYTDFLIENINLAINGHIPLLNIVLPIGISFFTFTQIAFLVDSYRGLVEKYHLLNYALFVTYFPHLIAGPIIHHKEVMPQFDKAKTFIFNYRNFMLGLTFFAIGLFKKSVIADSLVSLITPIFDSHESHLLFVDAWSAAIAYTLELYFDFSGYSDMAIGLSLLIGIKLPVNFYSPYKSINIIEFWRRWNMTLSRFLRDYLYIALGGNRKGSLRRYLNLLTTMVLGGLWHGANWTFVAWGSLHGIYLCINHGWQNLKKSLGWSQKSNFLTIACSRLITFIAVIVAWVFFRAPDFDKAVQIIHSMFFEKIIIPSYWYIPEPTKLLLSKLQITFSFETATTSPKSLFYLTSILSMVWLLPNSFQLLNRYKPALLKQQDFPSSQQTSWRWRPTRSWNYSISLLFVLGLINIQASSIFLYFRF